MEELIEKHVDDCIDNLFISLVQDVNIPFGGDVSPSLVYRIEEIKLSLTVALMIEINR